MFDAQRTRIAGLEEALRQMPAAVTIVEASSGQVIFANTEAQEMSERYLGRSVPTELGDLRDLDDGGTVEVLHPDGSPYEMEEWPVVRSITSGEEVRDEQIIHLLADGSRYVLRCDSSPIYDDEGRIVAGVLLTQDITGRKQAEAELKASQGRIESISDAFFVLDRKWRFTYLNERTLRLWEYKERGGGEKPTREGLLGKNIWELFPEAVDSVFYRNYHEALREQKTVQFDAYAPWSDRWFEVNAYPSEEGLSVYYRDVTGRRYDEEQLAYYARLKEDMHDAFIVTDERLLVRAWNKGAERMYGVTADEARGRDAREVVSLEMGDEPLAGTLREMAEKGRLHVEQVQHHKNGTSLYVDSLTIAMRDELGEVTGYLAINRDITEGKRAEEAINEAREAERSRIARDLHDEVLQFLSNAVAEAQLAQKSTSEEPELARRLARLSAALGRVERQVRGAIYDLRLEDERDKPFDELLESLVELQSCKDPDCETRLEVGDGVLSGPLGETGGQILRIIGEALTNARRHSGARNIRVAVWTSGDMLYAEVEDDGRGFDPAAEPPATASGGAGLKGMRERARAIGGVLRVESEPAMGTKVRFEMLLKRAREKGEEETERVRVLLVEDHATVRDALASAFEQEAGFEIVGQASSLAEARGMLGEIDVAVVDLGLPDGYGGDLIRELRAANPQAHALVLSANLDHAQTARAVESGAAGVLHKTAHLDAVVEAVKRLRAGETLLPLEEVVELLRFAGSRREEEHDARQLIACLTPREKEVLQALADGLASQEIAERLHIAVRTERNHMASILAKLGVHSQLQALVFALRYDVVEIR